MFEFWNEFDLKRPPLVMLPTTEAHFIRPLHPFLNKYFKWHTGKDTEFAQTAALLSRLMARRKNSFRNMIGFRAIRKLNAALCRLLRVDLPRDLERLRDALSDVVLYDADTTVEVPSRNSVDYVLVRLVSVHRIHERIRACCTEAAAYFSKLIRTNFFIEINTLLLAVFAKLHSLSVQMASKHGEVYNYLLCQRKYFPHSGSYTFLPAEVELPAKLEISLEAEVDSGANDATETVKTATVTLKPVAPVVSKVSKLQRKTDVGATVSREANPTTKTVAFSVDRLATVEDVKLFIASENKARKNSLQNCVTKQLLHHEWLGVQKIFQRKIIANEPKKALNLFRSFIGAKI